ncbi:outer membrane protein OmpK [Aliamphritea ceti]|uniref:outer membrane protein OmpK n=1 Tax=Aliamphritea ceti TaxID=1524258 RepID=UPI0021C2CB3D|nr:outer membrane protein OmpK [Aliamphritea ceti]
MKYKSMFIATSILCSTQAFAELKWQDFSISYLQGSDYEVGADDRQVITFEHASGHSWGDTFFFLDRTHYDGGTQDTYFEFQPRLSLGNLTSSDLSFGPVKDVYLAAQWESKSDSFGGFDNYMGGLGVDLDIPGFRYFKANIYQVTNDKNDNDQQLSISFAVPFSVAESEFLYDGFIDWSTSEDDHESEMNFTSQLKYNLGNVMGTESPFYVGIEYSHWNNKFGIKDVDERNVSFIAKWHF